MSGIKSTVTQATQDQNYNQTMSLITTSGTLELYVLSIDSDVFSVIPQSLVLDVVELNPSQASDIYLDWQQKRIPLISVATGPRTHALIIEGVEDGLHYAFAVTAAPEARKIRISAMKDIDHVDARLKNHAANQYVYQYVQHEDQVWIVPDLELIERELRASGSV